MKLRDEKGKEEKKNPLKFGWHLTCGLVAQLLCTKALFVSILSYEPRNMTKKS